MQLQEIKIGRINTKINSENRRYIYEHILLNPGIHLRKIVKETGLAMGYTQHHLYVLENEGRIKSRKIEQHKHRYYYPMTIINEQQELILAFLRQDTARDILIYLIEHTGSTQIDVTNFKNMSAPTISWHMSRLIKADIVLVNKEWKRVRYFIKDPESLIDSLKTYFPTVWNSLSDRFAKLFIQIFTGRKK
jgi:predicted transcriptional regulator